MAADTCKCGHIHATHTHYRPGRDCGACGHRCPRMRPDRWRRTRDTAAWAVVVVRTRRFWQRHTRERRRWP